MSRQKWICSIVGVLALLTAPAEAGWLVLQDGSALEIQGEPETRGKLVVFKRANGELASLRVSDVDFEASARRAELEKRRRARPKPEPVPEPKKEAVLVLTDADVAHVEPGSRETAPRAEVDETRPSPAEGGQEIIVRQWGREESDAGLLIFGILENRDENAAGAVELTITALDDRGKALASVEALIEVSTLLPGQTTRFEAVFEDLPPFSALDFAPQSTAMEIGWAEDFTLLRTDA